MFNIMFIHVGAPGERGKDGSAGERGMQGVVGPRGEEVCLCFLGMASRSLKEDNTLKTCNAALL